MFANKTNYLLELLLWQNSYDPKKKSQHKAAKPKPFVPPFFRSKENSPINNDSQSHTVDDIKSILSQPRG